MRKTDFENFDVGTVFNSCSVEGTPNRLDENVTIDYPSRLEAMALDPGQIVENDNLVYTAGQIDITTPLFKRVKIEVTDTIGSIAITDSTSRVPLVRHAALLMKHALGTEEGLLVDVENNFDLRHCGLGSSSSLIASVATAINELYGNPILPLDLVKYLAQNHGEEIDGDDSRLVPVQCIGGSAVCGNFDGGLIVLAGEATPIARLDVPDDVDVIIGIPNDFTHPDSQTLMQAEVDNIGGFKEAGEQYGNQIAYRMIHEVMPALTHGDITPAGRLIYDYRWDMGSIQNCSFVYPRMNEIADELRPIYEEGLCDVLALSSVGPGFFALTRDSEIVNSAFMACGMKTVATKVHNGKYEIVQENT